MQLREFEHRSLFAEIQSLSGVGSFDWNLQTNELYWSDHLFFIYGLEPTGNPMKVEDFVDRLHPDDRESTWKAIQHALSETGSMHHEERIIRADGAIRLLESRGLAIRDADGQPVRFLGACRDITDERETERALQWQLNGLALLSDVAKELLAKTATEKDWCRLSKRLTEHLECESYTFFRVDGDQMHLIAHDGLSPELACSLSHIKVGEHLCGLCALENELVYLDANQLRESAAGKAIYDQTMRTYVCMPLKDSGDVIGTLAFASSNRESFTQTQIDFVSAAGDVFAAALARRKADEDLLASEARCQLVVDHAKIVIWESDRSIGHFSYVTGSSEAFLGFSVSEWQKEGFWTRQIHEKDRESIVSAHDDAIKERRDYRQQYRMIRSDGEIIWIEHVAKVLVENNEVIGLRGAFVDISDRKMLEDQYLQAQKMEAVGTLTGGIAHDFNNLLTAIVANLEMVSGQKDLFPTDGSFDFVLEHVSAALEAAQRSAATVRQLLTFSRKDGPDQSPTDCNEVLRSTKTLLSQILDASICIDLDLCDSLPRVMGNASQLEHVIFNLCNNSRDAMPSGGRILLSTSVRNQDDAAFVVICVRDTGCGMSEQIQKRSFEPFFTTKDVDCGSGLGLSMCYAVVKQHGGTIRCESKLGEGTLMEIVLPAANDTVHKEVLPTSAKAPGWPLKSPTLLVVDDEEMVLNAIARLLEANGVRVQKACDGSEALRILNGSPDSTFDAVLLDRSMPGLDGWQTLQEINRIQPGLPVVLCSGYLGSEDPQTGGVQPGAILQKPYTIPELQLALHQAIGSDKEKATNS